MKTKLGVFDTDDLHAGWGRRLPFLGRRPSFWVLRVDMPDGSAKLDNGIPEEIIEAHIHDYRFSEVRETARREIRAGSCVGVEVDEEMFEGYSLWRYRFCRVGRDVITLTMSDAPEVVQGPVGQRFFGSLAPTRQESR